jgi:hypothetical protein
VAARIDETSIPRQLAQYQTQETIGDCNVGVIRRALDPKSRRIVAAIVMHPELSAVPQARREFLAASRAVATISDPHVAPPLRDA